MSIQKNDILNFAYAIEENTNTLFWDLSEITFKYGSTGRS